MKDHGIKQLANPAGDQDAVNLTSMKKYVGKNSIMAGHSHKKNALAYLRAGGVTAVNNVTSATYEDFTSNLHSVNKKAYTFNLVRTSVNSFNSRLKLDKKPLSEGEYTICVEFFFPKVDTNWFISASTPNPVDTLNYHTKHFNTHNPKYSRTIIHTRKYQNNDDTIYLDISNSAYDGSSAVEKAALTVYGVKGYQTDVDGAVYDQSYVIDSNGNFSLLTNLDMNGFDIKNYDRGYTIKDDEIDFEKNIDLNKKRIIGLKDGDRDAAAVNLKQVTGFLTTKKDKSYYKLIFEYFFDLLDPDSFDMVDSYGSNIKSIGGKLKLNNTVSLADFDVKNGFSINRSYIQLDETLTQRDNFTIFVSFLHDTSYTSYRNTNIGFLQVPISRNKFSFSPHIAIKHDGFTLNFIINRLEEESIPSAYQNKRLFLWFCKKSNNYKVIICQGGDINKVITSVDNNKEIGNRVLLALPYKVQRVGFSKNFYNLYEKEFHKISFLEKGHGTFFN